LFLVEEQVPGVPLVAARFHLHNGIDSLRRHSRIVNVVLARPQVVFLPDSQYRNIGPGYALSCFPPCVNLSVLYITVSVNIDVLRLPSCLNPSSFLEREKPSTRPRGRENESEFFRR
jgi:hypothetical protein